MSPPSPNLIMQSYLTFSNICQPMALKSWASKDMLEMIKPCTFARGLGRHYWPVMMDPFGFENGNASRRVSVAQWPRALGSWNFMSFGRYGILHIFTTWSQLTLCKGYTCITGSMRALNRFGYLPLVIIVRIVSCHRNFRC